MSTLQRIILVVGLTGSMAFAQTGPQSTNATAERSALSRLVVPDAPTPQVLLASNEAGPEGVNVAGTPGNLLIKPAMVAIATKKPTVSARQQEAFYSLMVAEHGAALLDAWSTRQVLRQGGRELDPLVRPFAHGPALYPALQATPFAVDYFAAKMMRSNNSLLRKLWWVPQVVATSGSVYCGVTNLGNRR